MTKNYRTLINIVSKLSSDDAISMAENLPLMFDTFSEVTSVILPFDDGDFVSFSVFSEVLSVSTSVNRFKLNSTETQLFLTMIKSYL